MTDDTKTSLCVECGGRGLVPECPSCLAVDRGPVPRLAREDGQYDPPKTDTEQFLRSAELGWRLSREALEAERKKTDALREENERLRLLENKLRSALALCREVLGRVDLTEWANIGPCPMYHGGGTPDECLCDEEARRLVVKEQVDRTLAALKEAVSPRTVDVKTDS